MNIQPLRLVVHSAHAIGLQHAVLLRKILLRKRLHYFSSALFNIVVDRGGWFGMGKARETADTELG
jgi:hypothetical protein